MTVPPDERRPAGPWTPPPASPPWTPPGQPAQGTNALPWVVGGTILVVLLFLIGAAVLVVRLGGSEDPPVTAAPAASAAGSAATAAPAQTVPPALPERPEAATASAPVERAELATRPVTEEGTLRSGTHGAATDVTFVNTRQDAVTVYWLDFDGKRVRYQQMPHDTQYTQPTYATHAWLVCAADGTPVVLVVATAQPGLVTIR
ncbi:hypothetical protein OHA72_31835 [Dactylosporangium sp. NBC_01737]|uniref:VHL beta domain-containing protein n=1 Tax=Dactylosporangium sp. NBC_01737 TaxID=2975959 RepID=UPI002E14D516|nr:hypothetical protein OHA72_31835 [Dactylosporangium sp. NBC_01737]